MAHENSKADGSQAKVKDKGGTVAKPNQPLTDFHKFRGLAVELQMMIIEEAMKEDEKDRDAKIVLFDHKTKRICPLAELSKDLSPMLFVNRLFRKVALKVYVMLDVIQVGVPHLGEPGRREDQLLNDYGGLEYSLEIARLVDREADGEGRFYQHKGRVYVRPDVDIFLTGLVPRQISNTHMFHYLVDTGSVDEWSVPICHVTERLPLSVCAKITTMRDLVWSPICPTCGEFHPIHCSQCFLEGRGNYLTEPGYNEAVYTNVKECGIYLMDGDNSPQTLMYLLATTEHPTQAFLDDMDENYAIIFWIPH